MKFGENGHRGGRTKGARNELTSHFFRDFYEVWKEQGIRAIRIMAVEHPDRFVQIGAALMPREVSLDIGGPLTELTDEELAAYIEQRRRELAQEPMKVIDAKPINGQRADANYEG